VLFAVSFVLALAVTAFLAYWMRSQAGRWGLAGVPKHDEMAEPVAKVGGLAIIAGIAISGATAGFLSGLAGEHVDESVFLRPVIMGAVAMCLVGLLDDRKEFRPRTKFLFQFLAASAVWIAGVRVGGFQAPGGYVELSPLLSYGLTLLWFVAITNAFNLVDGADGVAGGAAIIATAAMLVVALMLDQPLVALVLIITAGAVLAFLFFNFPPASIYLGDAGSLSLGFLLGGLGLIASSKATTALAIAIPVVSLGLPILDTSLAVVRRLLRGEGFYRRDLGHIHHRLQKLGHSPRQVALLLWGVCAILSLASLILLSSDMAAVGLVFLVVGAATFIGVQRLKIPELLEFRRFIDRGLLQPAVIARSIALREAVAGISEAPDVEAMLAEVGRAFEKTDFLEAEIRFMHKPGERETDEVVWHWERSEQEPVGESEDEPIEVKRMRHSSSRLWARNASAEFWEARVPFLGPDANTVAGWITVRRPLGGNALAELDVLTNTLLPVVSRRVLAAREAAEQLELSAEQDAKEQDGEVEVA
jgi:UDP-GlcNAc:undecaprenyl-phosphate GlcNAc-1-phosphate transferase